VAETVAATKTVDVPDALTDHIERRAAELAS
jgi:hypothetical protein